MASRILNTSGVLAGSDVSTKSNHFAKAAWCSTACSALPAEEAENLACVMKRSAHACRLKIPDLKSEADGRIIGEGEPEKSSERRANYHR